jgi:hypothetical protein
LAHPAFQKEKMGDSAGFIGGLDRRKEIIHGYAFLFTGFAGAVAGVVSSVSAL